MPQENKDKRKYRESIYLKIFCLKAIESIPHSIVKIKQIISIIGRVVSLLVCLARAS